MQHTQGSWAISDTSIKDGSGGFISDIHAPNQDNPSLENGTDPTVATTWYRAIEGEEEANARLIASAPDLLACLQNLIDRGLIVNDNDHYEECIKAIAKATGKGVNDD